MTASPLNNGLGILAASLVIGTIAFDVRSDLRRLIRARNVVLAGILAWFLLEAVMLSPELLQYPQSAYDFGIFCVLLSAGSFLLGYHLTGGCRLVDPVAARVRQLDDPRVLWRVVLVCAVIGFAPIVYYSRLQIYDLLKGILGMRRTWGGLIGRGRYGGFRDAMLQLEFFVSGAGPFAVLLLFYRRANIAQRVFCALVAIWPLLRAYGSGTRSSMLTSIGPLLAILYFQSSPRTQRRMIIAGLCLSPLVYLFMAAMIASRNAGSLSFEGVRDVSYVGNEMFQELVFITQNVPGKADFQLGHSYYVHLVNPIPRFLWPGKPKAGSGDLMSIMQGACDPTTGEVYLTTSPGLIGEMYLDFGLPGILVLSLFGGWLVRGWDRIPSWHAASLPTMVFYVGGLAALFNMGRSFTMTIFYELLFLFVGIAVITTILGRRRAPGAPRKALRISLVRLHPSAGR